MVIGKHVKRAYVNFTRDRQSVTTNGGRLYTSTASSKTSSIAYSARAKAYYNLSSRNLTGINLIYDNYIFENYHVDAGRDTKEIVHLLDDYCTVDVTRSDIDNGFSRKLQKAIFEEGLTLFPIVLIIFLVLLNPISVATNWIGNQKKNLC
ncbi:MAG TPA: hypothetical protein GX392_05695 [Clostridiales bacterium]|nr:hypothetical protein [Clostridiales bacterium]